MEILLRSLEHSYKTSQSLCREPLLYAMGRSLSDRKGSSKEGRTDKMGRQNGRGSSSPQSDSVIDILGKHVAEDFLLVCYLIMSLQVFYFNKILIWLILKYNSFYF